MNCKDCLYYDEKTQRCGMKMILDADSRCKHFEDMNSIHPQRTGKTLCYKEDVVDEFAALLAEKFSDDLSKSDPEMTKAMIYAIAKLFKQGKR